MVIAPTKNDTLFDSRQHPDSLVPPRSQSPSRLDVLLLVVGAFCRGFVERLLHANIRLHLSLRGLKTNAPGNLARRVDLYLMIVG